MNLPNRLTLLRIALIPVFVLLLLVPEQFESAALRGWMRLAALAVFTVAAITDFLDGHIARSRNLITPFGELMDPLADKLLTMSAFIAFIQIRDPLGHPVFPAWAVIIILARELLVTGLRSVAASSGRVIHADKWGKHKTVWQLVGIGIVIFTIAVTDLFLTPDTHHVALRTAVLYLYYLVVIALVAITALSGLVYYARHRDILDPP